MFRRHIGRDLAALPAVLVVLAACSQPSDQRVRVSGDATRQLVAGGATVVEDYGAFQVVKADPAALTTLAAGEADVLDPRILLNAGAFDPAEVRTLSARALAVPASGRTLSLVQFAGPVKPEWYDALAATGVRIVAYVPNDAYLVYGDAAAVTSLAAMARTSSFVRWAGAYLASDKLHPSVAAAETGAFSIQLVEDPEANERTLIGAALVEKQVTRASAELGYLNLVVHCDAAEVATLAAYPEVVSIQPWVEPTKVGERQAMIVSGNVFGNGPSAPGYLGWLASKGFAQGAFTASGFGVDISDSGVDNATPASPNHFGLYVAGNVADTSRLAYARLEGTPHAGSTVQGCDGHGNVNAHIVGGYASLSGASHEDAAGYRYGMGIAPFVRIGSSVIFDPSTYTNPDLEDLQSRAYRDGMRISSNSWGSGSTAYSASSQRYDALVRDAQPVGAAVSAPGNQEMTIVFAAGNSGPGATTIGNPGNAKNVISVGGTEGVQAFGGADGCGVTDAGADSFNDIASFSSRGPTPDGRRKPDLVAPATHISGGVFQADGQRANPPANPTGQAAACFSADSVCAGPGGSKFFPVGQQWYTASSGTSHSTPAVAGGAALVHQWFINGGLNPPSAAMTKAYLMNSARYLTGVGANDNLYSNNQGMGLLDLGSAFDGLPRILVDQEPADLFTASGQTFTLAGAVSADNVPFRVTLAWTDAPGNTTGAAYNNDLNLTVTVGGQTYLGNVFTGAYSVTGGAADIRNNVESVFLPAGLSGPFTITVTAANINSDGVPGNASALDQDFALVVYGACTTAPAGTPSGVTATATADNQVTVDWATVGAAEYRVYRSTVSGGPYTRIATVAAPPYVDTTVSGGGTYHYVVRAAECAESPNSNEASVVATGVCALPPVFGGATSAVSNGTATCGNTVSWAAATPVCGGAISYEVYRSTDAGFTPGRANRIATGVTGLSFLDAANLESGTTYHYVVRATEVSDAPNTDDNTVVQSTLARGGPTLAYFDDFDGNRPANAAAYWIASGTNLLSLVSNCHWQSSNTAFKFGALGVCGGAYTNSANSYLSLGGDGTVDPTINGFTIGAGATMTFHHWFNFENNFDGATLYYSTVSAAGPWTMVNDTVSATEPYISAGGYTGTAQGRRSWTNIFTGADGALRQVTVDLGALAGQRAWFAIRFTTDSSVVREGHYLDDVRLSAFGACTTGAVPPGPPASFAVALPAATGAGASAPVTVTALDAFGQAATAFAGTAAVTSSDPQAVLPAPISFTAGVALTAVQLRTLGAQTVTFTDPADSEVTGSGATTVTAGAPVALQFEVQPATATAGAPIAPAVKVRIVDQFGNLTAATDDVTIALGANPGGDTLAGTLTAAAVAGVATFPDLVLDVAANGYTLGATSGTLAGATSDPFDVVAAAPAALALLQDAVDTVAGEFLTPAVAIHDAFGNLATSASVTVTVSLGANPAGGTLSGTLTVAAVSGVATFPDLWIERVGSGYQLAFDSAGLAGIAGADFTIGHAAPELLRFVQAPGLVVAGDLFAPAPSVVVLDRFDNLATGYIGNVTLGLGVNPAAAALTGTTTELALNGVATFPDVGLPVAGVGYALSASSGGLVRATSTSFDVVAGPVAQLVFATQPAGSVAGGAIAGPPSVWLVDAFGNRQPGAAGAITLSLASNPGGDTLAGTLTVDAVGGAATFTALSLQRAADGYSLLASSAGLTAESGQFDIHPAAPAALEFTSSPGGTPAGAPLSPAPAVRVRDAFGNTVASSSATVTIAIGNNPSGGVLSGTASAAAAGGVATFPGLSIDAMGPGYTLAASSAGLAGAASGAFDVGSGAPAALAFVSQPANVQAGQALPAITVEIRDAWGNRTAATSDVFVAFAIAPGTATLSGTRRVSATAGQATFGDLSIDRSGAGYVLSAASAGLPIALTTSFDVTPGAVAAYVVNGLAPSAEKDTATTFGLTAVDQTGNVVTGYTGTAAVTSTDASAVLPAPVAFTAGVASGIAVTFKTAGVQSLTATDTAVASVRGTASTVVVAQPPPAESGCGCGTGNVGEFAILAALGALLRAATAPRRRKAA